MAYNKPKYDAACYYGGKLLGRCTVADGQADSAMMESCGNSAIRVMNEYAYFSQELKSILEKAAAIQAKQVGQSPGLFAQPEKSPWGDVDSCDILCPGVFMVSTPGHGGTMVSKEVAAFLSPAALKCGMRANGFICYEEDCQESVVLRELLDKKMWCIPERIKDTAAFEENINESLRKYNPDYWRWREQGQGKEHALVAPTLKKAAGLER